MECVVKYSGGLVSYEAAKRAIGRFGVAGVTLLFSDTKAEDPDLYRFLDETVAHLGCKLVRLADGRTPWQVFMDVRFIGNSKADPCSKLLKRKLMDEWVESNCENWRTVLAYGLDWSERGRIEGSGDKRGHRRATQDLGWNPWYPMDEKPYMTKADIIAGLRSVGIREPRLYELGFPHNNCGGFCVKMGLAQARHLLSTLPDVYRRNEDEEQRVLSEIPTALPFLRFRSKGRSRRVSMKEFREIAERQPMLFDDHGWGCGGGCAVD